ncbi:ATP-binding protein [Listeria sp. ILCC797]|uniref:HD domain-containing protein n=1 Tax=Listeria sp. ILCC797 TaxID=1918333 RepID=UPI0013563594|nr:ATP-binding protein [Listeria sp. ILCC797]
MDKTKYRDILKSSSNYTEEFTNKLISNYESLIPNIENHLKSISGTLPNFDIHDESHAENVLENMLTLSNYYEENHSKLTDIEYFLIIMSAYMHDSGMALPKWELTIFKATEGDGRFNLYNDIDLKIHNDGKKSYTYSKAKKYILDNKNLIYKDFNEIKNFIFIEKNEDEFINSLVKNLINYQEFRNGYTPELKNIENEQQYIKKSEEIRFEYIRSNHHIFSAKNCELLVSQLDPYFDDFTANKLCDDLSKIVEGHGLDFSEVKEYSLQSNYSNENYANPFFITMLLRLGDIIHFSADRSPKSLLSSKLIQNSTSLTHWKVKDGVSCWLTRFNEENKREIAYSTYFKVPKLYYFFQDYMNWIDMEISNYNIFLNILKKDVNLNDSLIYDLNLADKVNRSEVLYDKKLFEPVENLKFTLDQNKILDLLMSVGLYKDKHLCLRELYQNSMDACKCAIAGGVIEKGIIEFGIENDSNGRYLYCLDNGMGMTKTIIENYFLNIGTSYYTSRQFYEIKANWGKDVASTSQFGVGILSCFMLGNEIEVVTKNPYEKEDSIISFKIDGPHEKFYYKKSEEIDIEKIGNSGTLIKIYLSDQEINNEYLEDLDVRLFFSKRYNRGSYENSLSTELKDNIYFILFHSINIIPSEIDVSAKFNNGTSKAIVDNFISLKLNEIPQEKIKDITKQDYSPQYQDELLYIQEKWEKCDVEVVEVSSKNIYLATAIVYSQSDDEKLINIVSSYPLLNRGRLVSMNGVIVEEYKQITENFDWLFRRDINNNQPFIIDFNGENRPELSVDRRSITGFSDDLYDELKNLIEKLKIEAFEKINTIIEKCENKELMLEKLLDNMEIFKLDWIELLVKKNENTNNQLFKTLNNYLPDINNISEFFKAGTSKVKYNVLFEKLTIQEKMAYLSKILDAESIMLYDDFLEITTTKELKFNKYLLGKSYYRDSIPFFTYADNWDSYFSEYDMVTGLYPIVSKNLFQLTTYNKIDFNNRIKKIDTIGNGLSGMGSLQSFQLIPEIESIKLPRRQFVQKSRISDFDFTNANFWLFELNNSGDTVIEDHKDYILRVFISPGILSSDELKELEGIKEKRSSYYKGVREGWSVAFIGKTGKFVYESGKHRIVEFLKSFSSSLTEKENINYYLVSEEKVDLE